MVADATARVRAIVSPRTESKIGREETQKERKREKGRLSFVTLVTPILCIVDDYTQEG